jgi:hypothetical protein
MNDVSTVNIQWVSEQWLTILDTPFGAQLLERFQTTLDGALLACPKLKTSLRQSDLLKVWKVRSAKVWRMFTSCTAARRSILSPGCPRTLGARSGLPRGTWRLSSTAC